MFDSGQSLGKLPTLRRFVPPLRPKGQRREPPRKPDQGSGGFLLHSFLATKRGRPAAPGAGRRMSGQDAVGGTSSSLDLQQSKSDDPVPVIARITGRGGNQTYMPSADEVYGGPEPAIRAVETSFRHSGWSAERSRVRQALLRAGVSPFRLERFDKCGTSNWIEWSHSRQQHRMRAAYCSDRFCRPCAAAKARDIRANLRKWCQGETVRFGTFTLVADDKTLAEKLKHLRTSFKRLRASEVWRKAVRGGCGCVEIKRGKGSKKWHVHLHCLLVGGYLDHAKLSDAWKEATGGSYIVDIRAVKELERGIFYVSKYATKGLDRDVSNDREALNECVHCLRGARLFSTFGEWWGREPDAPDEAVNDWRPVARFHVVWRASLRGEDWARGVFRSLGISVGCVAGQPVFVKPEDDG